MDLDRHIGRWFSGVRARDLNIHIPGGVNGKAAYRRAAVLSPHDRGKRENFFAAKAELAYQRHMSGDFEGAVVLYRELLDDKSQSALTWYNLGLAYLELGRTEPARDAFERAVKLDPADKRFTSVLLDLEKVTKEKK